MRSFLPYFLVVLSLTAVFYYSRFSEAQSASSSYTYKINQQCLNDLKKGLLERETDISIYQFCEDSYQNSQDCCANPSECQEDFGREAVKRRNVCL